MTYRIGPETAWMVDRQVENIGKLGRRENILIDVQRDSQYIIPHQQCKDIKKGARALLKMVALTWKIVLKSRIHGQLYHRHR